MILGIGTGTLILIGIIVLILFNAINILQEYERGVVFFLGRYQKVKGPGLVLIFPGIQKMVVMSLRTVTLDIPPQDVITRDNVSIKVNAVVYFRVIAPEKALTFTPHGSVCLSKISCNCLFIFSLAERSSSISPWPHTLLKVVWASWDVA